LSSCGQLGAPCDNINVGPARTGTRGAPVTHVCRLHPSGGADQANRQAIQRLNSALVEQGGLLTGLPATHPMAVLRNYFHVGTLWLLPDGDVATDQLGSRSLANTTLESFQQQTNCFGCHDPKGTNDRKKFPVSHILFPRP